MTTSKEDERSKAIRYYFEEYLKDPAVIWESISEVACSSDEEAAARVSEVAEVIRQNQPNFRPGSGDYRCPFTQTYCVPSMPAMAGLGLSAHNYIMGLATARYDAEGVPEELQQ